MTYSLQKTIAFKQSIDQKEKSQEIDVQIKGVTKVSLFKLATSVQGACNYLKMRGILKSCK